jgi:hypothetical protein
MNFQINWRNYFCNSYGTRKGEEWHKRQYLGILYRLALMDHINGEKELAMGKYKKIVKLGNKLWIARDASGRLKELD